MSDPYQVNFDLFYDYYDLNKEERRYITNLFYIDTDYKEKESAQQIIKNIFSDYYTIEDIKNYFQLKFKDANLNRLYSILSKSFDFIHQYKNQFKVNDKTFDKKLDSLVKCKFREKDIIRLFGQPTETSLEPITGLDVNRCEVSTITSPTRTTALPLTKTVVDPVIDIESCVSPVTGCVCLSHLSPTRTTALPLTKTSLEPAIDFLGG